MFTPDCISNRGVQLVEKVFFYKIVRILYPYKNALWALRPCKAFGRSISASLPNPQTPFPGERLCLLCWLCIVQSLWAYTPGVRAGLNVGLPPSPRLGLRPKQGRFGCLPKVLHDAKPT